MNNIEIAPSILAANPGNYEKAFREVEGAEALHIDIMDGHFVANMTFGPWMLKLAQKYYSGTLDVHLMVDTPEHIVPLFLKEGCESLSFHLEASSEPEELLAQIKKGGAEAGLAINPDTPIEAVFPYLSSLDYILVMSVQAGYGGQPFQKESISRIQQLRTEINRQNQDVFVSVDGGVDSSNIADLAKAGVSRFVAGSSIFRSESPQKAITQLKSLATKACA